MPPGRTTTRIAHRLGGLATRRRRHRRVATAGLVGALVAIVLVIGGSGGDDDTTDAAPGSSPTTDTTIDPGIDDPILRACYENDRELEVARGALLRGNTAPRAAEEFLADAFVDLMRDRSAAIRAVEPPPSEQVLAVLDEFDAVVDAIEAEPSIGVGADPFVEVNEQWRAVGLDGCIIGSSTVPE